MTQREFVSAFAAEYGKRIQRGLPQSRAVAEIADEHAAARVVPGGWRGCVTCLFRRFLVSRRRRRGTAWTGLPHQHAVDAAPPAQQASGDSTRGGFRMALLCGSNCAARPSGPRAGKT